MSRVFFSWLFAFVFCAVVMMFCERIDWIKRYIIQGEYPFSRRR
jgi:hypothetical protein